MLLHGVSAIRLEGLVVPYAEVDGWDFACLDPAFEELVFPVGESRLNVVD
jgi:hypothetical protein